jgi:hypothetical protein
VVYNNFLHHTETYVPRSCSLNLNALGWKPRHLEHLDSPFVEEEIKKVISSTPKEKAPGPDGYIGLFFSNCWNTIKQDPILAVNHFYQFNQQGLHYLNEAYVVLVPKKANPERVYYFRPISLSHSFTKIISKLLANRLDPELHHLLSSNQMAFIKTRCIHATNCQRPSQEKIPIIFIKLDISKAFDTVNWPYLLSIMAHLGFGLRWIN